MLPLRMNGSIEKHKIHVDKMVYGKNFIQGSVKGSISRNFVSEIYDLTNCNFNSYFVPIEGTGKRVLITKPNDLRITTTWQGFFNITMRPEKFSLLPVNSPTMLFNRIDKYGNKSEYKMTNATYDSEGKCTSGRGGFVDPLTGIVKKY